MNSKDFQLLMTLGKIASYESTLCYTGWSISQYKDGSYVYLYSSGFYTKQRAITTIQKARYKEYQTKLVNKMKQLLEEKQ